MPRLWWMWTLAAIWVLGAGCGRPEVKPRDPSVLMRACEPARRMCTPEGWMKCARDRWSCYRLGLWHETGYLGRVKKDPARSRRLYGEMCDRVEVVACAALCRKFKVARRCVDRDLLALSGQGTPMARASHPVPKSRLLAFYASRLTKACRRGDLVACIVLGLRYDPLRSITSRRLGNCFDDKQRCFARACGVGAPLACAVLCHLGRKDRCVDLAVLALGNHGMGTQKFAEAERLLGALCRGGHLRACTVLGVGLLKGMPLLPDRSRAVKLLQRACQGGYERACSLLRRLPPISR
ncbi:MAG: sel1 repeat family protein [Deltaproteobacteria bacterium]|nr:sel1 repeat family protein [Deltaproteobacteria bacterium]